MKSSKGKWRLVTDTSVTCYNCGLTAGDRLRLLQPIPLRRGKKTTGEILPVGQIWTVVKGTKGTPNVVWLRQPDGRLHTWDDNKALFNFFELVGTSGTDRPHQ